MSDSSGFGGANWQNTHPSIHPSLPLLYLLHSGLAESFGAYSNCHRVKAGSHHGQVGHGQDFNSHIKCNWRYFLTHKTIQVSQMEKFEAHGCKALPVNTMLKWCLQYLDDKARKLLVPKHTVACWPGVVLAVTTMVKSGWRCVSGRVYTHNILNIHFLLYTWATRFTSLTDITISQYHSENAVNYIYNTKYKCNSITTVMFDFIAINHITNWQSSILCVNLPIEWLTSLPVTHSINSATSAFSCGCALLQTVIGPSPTQGIN